ncbi:uncharacterized protein H6S33_013124 [Morchella sextelata]|uniref:uncharacterized protein n=1 Tax=Morchella sextelata TaxID=1174677 RepID=UPI001D0493FE|nr:uncharacterized protein H6S33_013124 [Morchella sextelata]KAH0609638.1 hypothetical protein H6S33_013124 [Morchella sextelata]
MEGVDREAYQLSYCGKNPFRRVRYYERHRTWEPRYDPGYIEDRPLDKYKPNGLLLGLNHGRGASKKAIGMILYSGEEFSKHFRSRIQIARVAVMRTLNYVAYLSGLEADALIGEVKVLRKKYIRYFSGNTRSLTWGREAQASATKVFAICARQWFQPQFRQIVNYNGNTLIGKAQYHMY